MGSLISNLNEILDIKNEIKEVIGTESDLFSEFPQLISNAIAGGGGASEEEIYSYISSYLSSYSFIDQNTLSSNSYITMDDVSACGYITINDVPTVDLSSYVTKTELSNAGYLTSVPSEYITDSELSSMGYITINDVPGVDLSSYVTKSDLSNQSYVTQVSLSSNSYATESYVVSYVTSWGQSGAYNLVQRVEGLEDKTTQLDNRTYDVEGYVNSYNTRISTLENSGYVTQTSLSNNSYASTTYVVDKVNEMAGQIGKTDGDLIPLDNNTYTLGDSTHFYKASYVGDMFLGTDSRFSYRSVNQVNLYMNGNWRYIFHRNNFSPALTSVNLGTADQPWAYTYTNYLILNGQNAYTLFVTQDDLASRGFLTQHQDLSAYATIAYVTEKIPVSYDMSLYVTYTYLYSYVSDTLIQSLGNIETLLSQI